MFRPPLLHPLDVLGTAEVIPVLGFAQPTRLTGPFAGGLALRGGTKSLASAIAVIGNKTLLTMRAFAARGRRLHWGEKPPVKSPARRAQAGRKSGGEPDGKRREEEILLECWEEDGAGRKQQNQIGGFTPYSDQRSQTTCSREKLCRGVSYAEVRVAAFGCETKFFEWSFWAGFWGWICLEC